MKFYGVTLCLLLASVQADAAVILEHSGRVDLGTRYHTNLQFLPEGEESAYVYTLIPQYQAKALDGKNTWSGVVGVELSRSSNQDVRDQREDPFATLQWLRDLESGRFGLRYEYIKQSTRIAQVRETGILADDGTEKSQILAAEWKYLISNKLTLDTLASYRKSRFSGAGPLTNSKTKTLGATLNYSLNEKLMPYISVTGTDFDPGEAGKQKYQDYRAGVKWFVSPTLDFDVNLGNTHFSNDGRDKMIGRAVANFTKERGAASFGIARTVIPIDIGLLEITDTVDVSYDYDLSARNKLGALLALSETDSDFESQQVAGYISHEFTPSWLLRMDVAYVNVKDIGNESADDKSIGFTLTYRSPKF